MSATCKSVTAASIAAPFKEELSNQTNVLSASNERRPKLLGILANADEPSRIYALSTEKACNEVGIDYQLVTIGNKENPSQPGEVEQAVIEANLNPLVDGIMIYFPIFDPAEDQYLQQTISPAKDVEGLNFFFRFNLYHNIRFIKPSLLLTGKTPALSFEQSGLKEQEGSEVEKPGLVKAILPCTSLAVVKCLEHVGVYNNILPYGRRAFGKTVTVINRSEVVGRPLAALLANDGARVFSVDVNNIVEFTRRKANTDGSSNVPSWQPHHVTSQCNKTLEECLELSDVVISGVPSPNYKVKTAALKDGVVALNFASAKNFEDDIREKASIYIPNVGKVTIAMLQRNLLRLVSYRQVSQSPL